eukprot:scaffold165075_cov52-Attheya_sp.AAC.4
MVVGNTVQATMHLNENIVWGSIHTLINGNESPLSPSSSSTSSSSSSSSSSTLSRKRKCQDIKNFVDFRWMTSTCQSRAGSTSGVALPRLKPNIETPVLTKLFTGASTILPELEIPWIDSNQDNIFLDSSEPNRHIDFQERIAAGNIIEAIRVAKLNLSKLCGAHEDNTQNSTKPTMSAVFCISKICNNDCYSLISYGHKSIDVALEEASHVKPFTKAIVNFSSLIDMKKRTITTDLLQGNQTSPIPNFPVISNKCNMNPFSYQLRA